MRTISANFFRVEIEGNTKKDFHEILQDIAAISHKPDREREVKNSVTVRLEHISGSSEFIRGQFCRKEMSDIPPSVGPDGIQPTVLQYGHGLGYLAAFIYHIPTRIILLENNRMSVTQSRLNQYLKCFDDKYNFKLRPVEKSGEIDRIKGKNFRKLKFKLAGVRSYEAIEDIESSSIRSVMGCARQYNANTIEITVGVTRKRDDILDRENSLDEIESLISSGILLDNLSIEAVDESGKENIDLLNCFLRIKTTLNIPSNNTESAYSIRNTFLSRGFNDNLQMLRKTFEGT